MSKMNISIWERDFELPIIIKQFKGKEITDLQRDAVSGLESNKGIVDVAFEDVKAYILKNGLKENGIDQVENIFKYVMPKSISVPKSKTRKIAIMCNFKYDMEHGLAIVFENEEFVTVGPQDIVL